MHRHSPDISFLTATICVTAYLIKRCQIYLHLSDYFTLNDLEMYNIICRNVATGKKKKMFPASQGSYFPICANSLSLLTLCFWILILMTKKIRHMTAASLCSTSRLNFFKFDEEDASKFDFVISAYSTGVITIMPLSHIVWGMYVGCLLHIP